MKLLRFSTFLTYWIYWVGACFFPLPLLSPPWLWCAVVSAAAAACVAVWKACLAAAGEETCWGCRCGVCGGGCGLCPGPRAEECEPPCSPVRRSWSDSGCGLGVLCCLTVVCGFWSCCRVGGGGCWVRALPCLVPAVVVSCSWGVGCVSGWSAVLPVSCLAAGGGCWLLLAAGVGVVVPPLRGSRPHVFGPLVYCSSPSRRLLSRASALCPLGAWGSSSGNCTSLRPPLWLLACWCCGRLVAARALPGGLRLAKICAQAFLLARNKQTTDTFLRPGTFCVFVPSSSTCIGHLCKQCLAK